MNHLSGEKSNYLLQHKDNPVHWHTLEQVIKNQAIREDIPIFLSIGYSSCHWCHVMAHECFEDQEVANFLNSNFLNIKVDREEYPDVDDYYQKASQRISGQGGWPLSAFLLPNLQPFFVGTYFPKNSFLEILEKIKYAYEKNRTELENNAKSILDSILTPERGSFHHDSFPYPMAIFSAIEQFQDNENGGYGNAPRFPNFSFLEWSIEQIQEAKVEKKYADHIVKTIENMMMGGIYDQARGGIHRYSVDDEWQIPHFEKMLYDQAGLIKVLAKFSLINPSSLILDALFDTLDYLAKEMQSDRGDFFSSQDADSQGEEGLYFTFTQNEFNLLINDKVGRWFKTTSHENLNHGQKVISLNSIYKSEFLLDENWEKIRLFKKQILLERRNRIPPDTDNKGVASWNFMLISALCDVIQYCPIPGIKTLAQKILNNSVKGALDTFIIQGKTSGTSIRHTTTKDESLQYFEDYVFFAESQLRLYELTANHDFKNNFLDSLEFIYLKFIENGRARIREITDKEFIIPNLETEIFESSYKSPLATLIAISRRAEILLAKKKGNNLDQLMDLAKAECLRFPLGAGESLRALTYPDKAYYLVKVPLNWLDEESFINFLPHFTTRFVLDYHSKPDDGWEVCTFNACELSGVGIENFISTLSSPPKKSSP